MSSSTIKNDTLTICFVTGNANKLKEVQQIIGENGPIKLNSQKIDLPEIQGDPENVVIAKCQAAAEKANGPTIVEDTSLCFNALGGLPGVYIRPFLEKLGHDGLNKLLMGFDDTSACAQCIFGFTEGPGQDVKLFVGQCKGNIVDARGPNAFGWDPIFQPEGFDQTFAEMAKETKNKISHRSNALAKLQTFFAENASTIAEGISSKNKRQCIDQTQ